MNDIREQIKRLQMTERCYCGSKVIDGELQLIACLFHQSAGTMKKMLAVVESARKVRLVLFGDDSDKAQIADYADMQAKLAALDQK